MLKNKSILMMHPANFSSSSFQVWDEASKEWTNKWRITYTYSGNNISMELTQGWDDWIKQVER